MIALRHGVVALALVAIAWPNASGRAQGDLVGSEWRVVAVAGKPVANAGTLRFEAGKINGRAACNRYFGTLKETDTGFEIGAIGSTKMLCPDVMDVERAYLNALAQAKAAKRTGNALVLTDAVGLPLVALER